MYTLTGRETVIVDIGIIEDDKFEHAEEFYASLSFVVVLPRVTLQPNLTEINIIDAASELIYSVNLGNIVDEVGKFVSVVINHTYFPV